MTADNNVPRPATLIGIYVVAIAGTAGVLGTGGRVLYWQGASNQDASIAAVLMQPAGLVLALCALTVLAILIGMYHASKPRLAGHAAGALCVLVVLGSVAWVLSPGQDTAYQQGFERWVQEHVEASAILGWHASLPASTTVTVEVLHDSDPPAPSETLRTQWPAEIRSLGPKRVTRLSTGVMLEWGSFGTWGNARRVFVSTDGVDPTPTEPNLHFQYNAIDAFRWVAVQGTG